MHYAKVLCKVHYCFEKVIKRCHAVKRRLQPAKENINVVNYQKSKHKMR